MRSLRWLLLALCVGAALLVTGRAPWTTTFVAPGTGLCYVHGDPAPLWAPPAAKSLQQLRATLGRGEKKWHEVDAASVSAHLDVEWEPMIGNMLLLLVPATILPGWLYARTRDRRRDAVLHVALFAGCGLSLGLVVSLALWLALGGWGPPWFVESCVAGLGAGAIGGLLSLRRNAALRAGSTGQRREAADRA